MIIVYLNINNSFSALMSHDNGFHVFNPVGTVFGSAVIALIRCDFEILLFDAYSHLTRDISQQRCD